MYLGVILENRTKISANYLNQKCLQFQLTLVFRLIFILNTIRATDKYHNRFIIQNNLMTQNIQADWKSPKSACIY